MINQKISTILSAQVYSSEKTPITEYLFNSLKISSLKRTNVNHILIHNHIINNEPKKVAN